MIWLLWLAPLGYGGQFYLEGPYVSARSDVVQMQEDVADAGHPGRVVRRFVDGEGWRFLVRIEGFAEEGDALTAADTLVDALGVALEVLSVDGTAATFVARIEPGGDEAVPELPSGALDPVAQQGAMRVLSRSAVAHGVDRDTLTEWMEGPSVMAYRRSFADGTVVDHRWATRDGAVFVEIEAVSGDARSSRLFLKGDQAWLAVEDGDWVEQDLTRTVAIAADFGPAAIVPLVFVLRQAMESRREFALMQRAGRGEIDGVATDVLGYGGGQESAPLVIEIGVKDGLIRRASFAGGDVVHQFADYREVGDLILPHRIVGRRRGGVSDTVEIQRIATGNSALDEPFAAPDTTPGQH